MATWIRRDHPVAEFLFRVAARTPDFPDRVLSQAWHAALAAARSNPGSPSLRALVLGEVLRTLNSNDQLDGGRATAPVPGPYLPAGDPWEGWWSDDDAVAPLPADLRRETITTALRQLPLGHRVLLVLRDSAGLDPDDAANLVQGSADRQDVLLAEARVGFICLIDDYIVREANS